MCIYNVDISTKRVYNIIIANAKSVKLNSMASVRKEKNMKEMNGFELETFLKMILEILNGCKDIEEAREKIKALLER